MVDFDALRRHLEQHPRERFGLLSQQALDTDARLHAAFGDRLVAMFSAEHGWFGLAAPGEKTTAEMHPYWHIPVHSLYGETRKPTPAMLAGLDRIVIDLQDLGVRCYTYLATTKLMLEAAAEAGLAVTVLDRPVPLGGVVDGPGREDAFSSFVAPLNVPLCHGMTTGEYATCIVHSQALNVDLTVIPMANWTHRTREPWANFLPPSPGIRTWDSAVLYPATVFTEAYPAVDCDRAGPLSFRVLGAPWLDASHVLRELADLPETCGIGLRPYRYRSSYGKCAGQVLDGILLSLANAETYRPIIAGTRLFACLQRRHPEEIAVEGRPEWFDKLWGSSATREAVAANDLPGLFRRWEAQQATYSAIQVNLYA
ncbi:MAG: DUF1343 domain-containing protein [Kiritimatiellae bacterium]|nr:DUF1343 domain-containing protein [Kiritimatiellia bacterium]